MDCWYRLWFEAARNQRTLQSSWDLHRTTRLSRDQATQLACWRIHQVGHLLTAISFDIANAVSMVRFEPDRIDTLAVRSEGVCLHRQLDRLMIRSFRALLPGDARGWCAVLRQEVLRTAGHRQLCDRSDPDPHVCSQCDAVFRTTQALRTHIARAHGMH
eukprot:13324885-Heterocapsa_arctica.AAC.1